MCWEVGGDFVRETASLATVTQSEQIDRGICSRWDYDHTDLCSPAKNNKLTRFVCTDVCKNKGEPSCLLLKGYRHL